MAERQTNSPPYIQSTTALEAHTPSELVLKNPILSVQTEVSYFLTKQPSVVGTKLGFTADLGFGLEVKAKGKPDFTIGYKYYHILNGGRGIQKPRL